MRITSSRRAMVAAALFSLGAAAPGRAAFLTIVNAGFESPTLGDNGLTTNSIPGWVVETASGSAGIYNPSSVHYPGGLAPEGSNIAYSVAARRFYQTLTDSLLADTTYTLSVMVGYQGFAGTPIGGYSVELFAGSTVIASDVNVKTITKGTFQLVTITYNSSVADPLTGQALKIRLGSTLTTASNAQTNFDDVKLSAVARVVPEPSALVLAGVGAGCLGLSRARRLVGLGWSRGR